jgi:hypothetical protein
MWVAYKNTYPDCCAEKYDNISRAFIEIRQPSIISAHTKFKERTDFSPLELCEECDGRHFTWEVADSLKEASAESRFCKWDKENSCWLEISKDDDDPEMYVALSEYLTWDDIIVVKLDYFSDGMKCCGCGLWYPMAEPNEGNKLRCWTCRKRP